ncbi:MAG: hypothetical protein KDC38_19690 [Planctomycetes bacterium]|nr:hypothetical protein [Planctomycetota bacterium]
MSFRTLASAILMVSLLTPTTLLAHELAFGVGTQTAFFFHPDHLDIELNFGVSSAECWTYLTRMDSDYDEVISEAEAQAFLSAWAPKLLAGLDLRVNGVALHPEIVEQWEVGIRGRLLTKALDAFYKLRAPLPRELPGGGWWLHFRDTTFETEPSSQFCWVRRIGQGESMSYWIFEPPPQPMWGGDFQTAGRAFTVFFDDEFRTDILPGTTSVPMPSQLRALLDAGSDPTPTGSGDEPVAEPRSEPRGDDARIEDTSTPRPLLTGSILVVGLGLVALVWWARRRRA